jgi:hypothetical protein
MTLREGKKAAEKVCERQAVIQSASLVSGPGMMRQNYDKECMRIITVDAVVAAAHRQLERQRSP